MAGFLYYAEGRTNLSKTLLERWGLGYAFEKSPSYSECATRTPSGTAGMIFADMHRLNGKPLGMRMDEQEWAQLPEVEGRPRIWAGHYRSAVPQPADLARSYLIDGMGVSMQRNSAAKWQIPEVRCFDGEAYEPAPGLPRKWIANAAGEWERGDVRDVYKELWDLTAPLATAHIEGEKIDERDLVKAVAALLQANYVIDGPEMMMLELLEDDSLLALAAMASCRVNDLETFMVIAQGASDQKKKISFNSRWMQYCLWRDGRRPGHAPTWAELVAYQLGL